MAARSRNRRRAWIARSSAAIATALILATVLMLAGHSGSRVGQVGSVVTPRCTKHDGQAVNVARDGFTLECGAGSAVVLGDGHWHVMAAGTCPNSGLAPTMYFGAHTARDIPHTGLTLHMQSYGHDPSTNFLIYPNSAAAIDGYIETRPGVEEPVSGRATIAPGTISRGTFIVRGSSGATYIGGWTCASRAPSSLTAPVVALPRCSRQDDRNQGTYRNGFAVACGPASAVILSAGRWHVMDTGVCDLGNGDLLFGVRTQRDVAHAGLIMNGAVDLHPGHAWGIGDEYIETVPGGTEERSGGTATTAVGGRRGTFIIGSSQYPDRNQPFVGAFDCGSPR